MGCGCEGGAAAPPVGAAASHGLPVSPIAKWMVQIGPGRVFLFVDKAQADAEAARRGTVAEPYPPAPEATDDEPTEPGGSADSPDADG